MIDEAAAVVSLARDLQLVACMTGHRRLLFLGGDALWGRRIAAEVVNALAPRRALWIGSGPGATSPEDALKHLGCEVDLLVYDGHSGFDPDGFAGVCGTLSGGGLMLLVAWPLESWADAPDPVRARLAVHPVQPSDVSGRFLRRFSALLQADPAVTRVAQGVAFSPVVSLPDAPAAPIELPDGECRTADQAEAVEAVQHVVSGHRRRPLVITADRGRGKSAALGIAVARLFRDGASPSIAVTAPQRASVDAVFEHAARLLDGARVQRTRLSWSGHELYFVAPDALAGEEAAARGPQPDLVLVDEAAALPASLLERLVRRCPRLVFSTTVHGYEGSGRGFAVRFGDTLTRNAPGWKATHLDSPVRWAPGDPLEDLLFRALLLDAEPDGMMPSEGEEAGVAECLDRDRLAADEALLRQVFGLLVAAHYRTSPLDLRHLLDGPNLQVWVVRRGERVLATALVAEEGGFDAALARAVWAGQRRPRGHLMPQALGLQLGLSRAAGMRALRVVRIAVHPDLRRRGIGTALVNAVVESGRSRGFDLAGASFAATPEVIAFWRKAGMLPVSLGSRPETTTGAHSVLVARAVSAAGESLAGDARARFIRDLLCQLADTLSRVDPAVVAAVSGCPDTRPGDLSPEERGLLEGFARERRPFEFSRPALCRLGALVVGTAGVLDGLPARERDAFVVRVLQARPWPEAVQIARVSGRGELIVLLRQATARLLAGLAAGMKNGALPGGSRGGQ